jgi:YfiH family protein
MLRPPGFRGVAFTQAGDGDPFADDEARSRISQELEVSQNWATVSQVHGAGVAVADEPGIVGDADAIVTSERDLALAVKTADCVPIVIEAEDAVGVVHAGWRGIEAGVIESTLAAMVESGHHPIRAAVGPAIGPCCYEVGPEVVEAVGSRASTTWGTNSVDLWSAASDRLDVAVVWRADVCTMCGDDYSSHRRDQTKARQAGIGWMP